MGVKVCRNVEQAVLTYADYDALDWAEVTFCTKFTSYLPVASRSTLPGTSLSDRLRRTPTNLSPRRPESESRSACPRRRPSDDFRWSTRKRWTHPRTST